MQQIKQEMDDQDAKKEDDAEIKKRTNEIEADILNGKTGKSTKKPITGWNKRKDINGDIIGEDHSRAAKKDTPMANTLDNALMSFLTASQTPNDLSHSCPEEIAEKNMLAYVLRTAKTTESLFEEGKVLISDEDSRYELYQSLDNISIEIFISIYCSVGEKFSAKTFKDAIMTMLPVGTPPLILHKLYNLMNIWKSESSKLCPVPIAPMSSSSSSFITTSSPDEDGLENEYYHA